ncbi:MAG: exodeoxyribonuclease VII small subunit [Pseudomonadota bacterium]
MSDGKDIAAMSFEEALAALETVVGQLEGGQVPLEESIALYTRGNELKKHCEDRLKDAELKVQKIVLSDGGEPGTEPFETS